MKNLTLIMLMIIIFGVYMNESFAQKNNNFAKERKIMVFTQIQLRGIKDKNVLNAMKKVERHLFVPPARARCTRDTRVRRDTSRPVRGKRGIFYRC